MDFLRGMQSAMAGFEMGQIVRQQIDARKHARELDRLLSGIGNRAPTQQEFIKLTRLMGPEPANAIMDFQKTIQDLEEGDRAMAREDMMAGMDFAGNMASTLMAEPVEGDDYGSRMDALIQMVNPMAQDPRMTDLIKPFMSMVQDGDLSDERLNTIATTAWGFGRHGEIMDNKVRAQEARDTLAAEQAHDREMLEQEQAFEAEQSDADRAVQIEEIRRANPTPEERRAAAAAMKEQYGGTMASWYAFIGPNPERMLEESFDAEGNTQFVNKSTNKPLNLGTFTMGDPNEPLNNGAIDPDWFINQ